jgi:hypothetical protein
MTVQSPKQSIFCPDCDDYVRVTGHAEFVKHREVEHPPDTARTLAPNGIRTAMAFGNDPKE